MAEHSEHFHFLKELFPAAGTELMQLLQGAAENAFLVRSDFYTMRDWLEIAEYRDQDVPHAILLLMLVALEEGSLCIEIAEPALLPRLRDFVPEAEATAWARRIAEVIDRRGYPALIGTSPTDHKPVIAHTVGSKRFLYFQKFLRAELDFQHDLNQRLDQPAESPDVPWPKIVSEVLAGDSLRLDREQQLALASALLNNLAVISGGPGTGKTSIVLTLVRCLIRGGFAADRIALAAPTGRAAQRLTDSLRAGLERQLSSQDASAPDAKLRGLAARTLHQLLGYRPTRNVFSRHRENLIPADVVIVDEVSMVGLTLMAQLFQAIAPTTKLILLGDKDQLPSVEAGAVLAHLVPDGWSNGFHGARAQQLAAIFPDLDFPPAPSANPLQNRVVLLQTNHRSEQQIRAAAQAINRQDASVADRLPVLTFSTDVPIETRWQNLETQGGCWLLEQALGTANELRGFLQHWAEQAYFRSRLDGATLADLIDGIELDDRAEHNTPKQFQQLFRLLDRFRLLTLVRESAWGCEEINSFLEALLRPRLDAGARSGLFAGAPVLITRNDSARGLFNGDVGITLRTRGGRLSVLFPRHDGVASFPAESLPAHELGFALTVHKSQGSEYANVMVVVPPKGGKRLLTKELIYTAITRAKALAVICSTKEVLKFAIGRRIVRDSGLLRF
jgi:exodeoxyribonuclease V alpha subunit